jgi:hypothetical protein
MTVPESKYVCEIPNILTYEADDLREINYAMDKLALW